MTELTESTTTKGSWWSITINNPTEGDYDSLKEDSWPSFVKRVKFQTEQGSEGTIHIQGAVNTTQIRFSTIKKWLSRAHIEKARDVQALIKYVGKEDTRIDTKPSGDIDKAERFVTCEKALCMMVPYYNIVKSDKKWYSDEYLVSQKYNNESVQTDIFWATVRLVLREHPNLVALYTNPQMLRAWLHTKDVWIDAYNNASESDNHSVDE